MKHYPKIFFTLLALSLVLSGCGSAETGSTPVPEGGESGNLGTVISATGVVIPEPWAALSARSPGVVAKVLVTEGELVSTGQILIQLDGQEAAQANLIAAQQAYASILRNENSDRARLWQAYMDAQKARETARKKWNDINLRDIENRLEDRQKDVEDRQVDLEQAQRDFEKYKSLNKDDPKYRNAEDKLEAAQADYDEAVKNLEATMRERDIPKANLQAALASEAEAKYQYEITLNGPNADQLALAKAQLDAAKDAYDMHMITAPFDGVVCNLEAHIGEWVIPGIPILQLGDLNNLRVETTDLNEIDAARVHPQDVVIVTFDALPDVMVQGTILSVANKSAEGSGVNYTAIILLDTVPNGLKWGMTAFADIKVSE